MCDVCFSTGLALPALTRRGTRLWWTLAALQEPNVESTRRRPSGQQYSDQLHSRTEAISHW